VPIALSEAVEEGRIKVGDRIVFVAFGAGFTSGAITLQWTADPLRARLAEGIGPESVSVRQPVDWESVDPMPAALAEILARPTPGLGELALDDVVEAVATESAAVATSAAATDVAAESVPG
jgi:hypothetical protein